MAFQKSIQDPYDPTRTLPNSYWRPRLVAIDEAAMTVQIRFDGYASAAVFAQSPDRVLESRSYNRNLGPYLAALASGDLNPLNLPNQVALDSDDFFATATVVA